MPTTLLYYLILSLRSFDFGELFNLFSFLMVSPINRQFCGNHSFVLLVFTKFSREPSAQCKRFKRGQIYHNLFKFSILPEIMVRISHRCIHILFIKKPRSSALYLFEHLHVLYEMRPQRLQAWTQ